MWDLNTLATLTRNCRYCGNEKFTIVGKEGEEFLFKCNECGKQRYEQ